MDTRPFPEHLATGRIELRLHEPGFAPAMFRVVDAERERLRTFLTWVDGTRSEQDILAFIQSSREGHAQGTTAEYGIFGAGEGIYLGNIGVHNIRREHGCAEIGYWIRARYEGQGYVTEAARLLEETCFGLGFHRVEIRCNARNLRSAAVPGRLGYTLDGCLRHDTLEYGQWRDTLVFGKLEPGRLAPAFAPVFREAARIVHAMAIEKGWWEEDRNEGELIALMHSELSEALEGLRHGNPPSDHIPDFSAMEEEFADVLIRIMDHAAAKGYRVGEALEAKIAFNHTRPRKHGGKAF